MTIEEVLSSTTLKDVLPVLSLETKRVLTEDLERVVKAMGSKQKHHVLREVYRAVKSAYEAENHKTEKTEAELDSFCARV